MPGWCGSGGVYLRIRGQGGCRHGLADPRWHPPLGKVLAPLLLQRMEAGEESVGADADAHPPAVVDHTLLFIHPSAAFRLQLAHQPQVIAVEQRIVVLGERDDQVVLDVVVQRHVGRDAQRRVHHLVPRAIGQRDLAGQVIDLLPANGAVDPLAFGEHGIVLSGWWGAGRPAKVSFLERSWRTIPWEYSLQAARAGEARHRYPLKRGLQLVWHIDRAGSIFPIFLPVD